MAVHLPRSIHLPSLGPLRAATSYDLSPIRGDGSPSNMLSREGLLIGFSPRHGGGGFDHLPSQLPHISPTSAPSPGGYGQSYSSASTSPGGGPVVHHDSMAMPGSASVTPDMAARHLSSGAIQAQKRAYRQRRKDPSCDACRERKVKCDATDMTSCSECSSRTVKCQFTKETNKRMSSIKQVQDLEKQLAQARQQLDMMHSSTSSPRAAEGDSIPPLHPLSIPKPGMHRRRHSSLPEPQNLSRARANLRKYGRGIFRSPQISTQRGLPMSFTTDVPDLPPKQEADYLLSRYHSTVHVVFPVVHWPTFIRTYETAYKVGTLQGVPQIWASLLFAVLACGLLHTTDESARRLGRAKAYVDVSRRLNNTPEDEPTLDHARASLLTSMAYMEMNLKSAGWTWLGWTVRIAQDIGLHCESGRWPVIEGEMRRRTWWAIYVWDRVASLELSKPLLIDDDDCNVEPPSPTDDYDVQDTGMRTIAAGTSTEGLLLAAVRTARCVGPLRKALKNPKVDGPTLASFDDHFASCVTAFPAGLRLHSTQHLAPEALTPIAYLQNARLVLDRHNLSTFCAPEVRAAAMDRCIVTARDTTQFLARTMDSTPMSPGCGDNHGKWEGRLAGAASASLCTHIWRCTLFLCFGGYYAEAITCVRASAAIGTLKRVNTACGRNLAFFLDVLVDKLHRGERYSLQKDEEMMAYVSGDLQGSAEDGWIWQGSEGAVAAGRTESSPIQRFEMGGRDGEVSASPALALASEEDDEKWRAWDRVHELLQGLLEEQHGRLRSPSVLSPPSRHGAKMQPPPTAQSQSSRISIASII
ncbi:MAG: hypothetical protein M1832_003709 [Thelocarpon impressellum]|nr:MAG: hypothetical protein M1832_003709 [Thelocarpon impressellum]